MSFVNLDSFEQIQKIDKENIYGSIQAFPDQCADAWTQVHKIKIPSSYKNINKLVMTGMGGSGLASRLINGLYKTKLKIPLIQVHGYDIPSFVDENTLVICSSYSGTTEETIENAYQAIAKKAKLMAIGTGSTLEQIAKQNQIPFYKINPIHNPSNQPRMAVGYSVIGQIALITKIKLINLSHQQLNQTIDTLKEKQLQLNIDIPESQNPAKQLAKMMYGKIINFVAAEHLTGALHTIKNQSNENAKTFSTRFDIPELNHHLLEGLKYPQQNFQNLFFLIVQSNLYRGENQKRVIITKDIIGKHQIASYLYQPKSQNKLSQAFETVQFGAYTIFYLSMLYSTNPAPIPWVNYFKKQLKK